VKKIDAGASICFHEPMVNPIRWPKQTHLSAVLGLLTLNLLLFADTLSTSTRVLSSSQADIYLHFAAWRQFGFDEMRKGHLPLWNPHYLCGNPFLGNFESALLYPLNWQYLCMPLAAAINWGIVLHVFLAGFFTYLWASYRGFHPLAAFLSGAIFMWGGAYYLHLYAGHLPNLCVMVWASLIFLAIDGFLDQQKGLWILLGIFSVSMQILAGHPQYVYFTGLAAAFYLVLNLKKHSHKLNAFMGFAGFYVGALLVTAVQSWTGLEALWDSARHLSLDFSSASSFSFPPQNLLTVFLPDFFGNLEPGHYWGSWYLWEVSLFIGMTSFVLAVSAVIQVKPQERRWALTMVLVTLMIAFGAYTPFYSFLYHFVPLFNGIRGVSKFVFLSSLFLAMLSGMGLNHWLINPQSSSKWFGVLMGIGVVFLGLGGLVYGSALKGLEGIWGHVFSTLPWLNRPFALMDLPAQNHLVIQSGIGAGSSLLWGGVICLVLALLFYFGSTRKIAVYGIAVLAILELFVFARTNRPTFDMSQLQASYDRISGFFLKNPGDYRVYGIEAKSLVADGLDIWEDEPMVPSRYAKFVCYSQGIAENRLFSVSPVFTKFGKVFGLIRLKNLLSDDGQALHSYGLPFPIMPRMALIYHWDIQPDSATELKTITDENFNPSQIVLLETTPGFLSIPGDERGGLRWIDHSTDEIEVQAKTIKPCILLVTDNYSPGWKAEALPDSSQKDYQVLPGDYFLRAIPLEPGHHHFVLKYRPVSFEIGKWVSLLSCFLYIAILLHLWRRCYIQGSKEIL
jgi:hypothetical protein